MKIKILILGLICLLISCAVAPVPIQIKSTFPVEKTFDDTWTGVIETFAEMSLPIMNMEKASGLITTDWITLSSSQRKLYCDCGKLGFPDIETGRDVKFNVFIKKIADSSCEIRITCLFRQRCEGYGHVFYMRDCVSTGKFEADMYKIILSKLR